MTYVQWCMCDMNTRQIDASTCAPRRAPTIASEYAKRMAEELLVQVH